MKAQLNEPVLDDDYPVYCGYCYVADGEMIESPFLGTVQGLKQYLKVSEIRRCDLVGRFLMTEKD